jgi:hypothetical protein
LSELEPALVAWRQTLHDGNRAVHTAEFDLAGLMEEFTAWTGRVNRDIHHYGSLGPDVETGAARVLHDLRELRMTVLGVNLMRDRVYRPQPTAARTDPGTASFDHGSAFVPIQIEEVHGEATAGAEACPSVGRDPEGPHDDTVSYVTAVSLDNASSAQGVMAVRGSAAQAAVVRVKEPPPIQAACGAAPPRRNSGPVVPKPAGHLPPLTDHSNIFTQRKF